MSKAEIVSDDVRCAVVADPYELRTIEYNGESVEIEIPRYIGRQPTKLHAVWKNIKVRCRDRRHPQWHRYGGRGVDVCDEWHDSWQVFAKWCLAHGWSEGLTIDRIDNDRWYEPGNVQFVARGENSARAEVTAARREAGGENMRAYHADRVERGLAGPNARAVRCVETGDVYESGWAASEAFGMSRKTCYAAIRRGGLMAGLHWEYADGGVIQG